MEGLETEVQSQPSSKDDELREFLDTIFKRDQNDPERRGAASCYKDLINQRDRFAGTPVEKEYWNAVSLELFHMAQTCALDGNHDEARDLFSEAHEAAQKGISREWQAYINGTICYLDNDMAGLEQVIPHADENAPVLRRLFSGLQRRGSPDYRVDYYAMGEPGSPAVDS